MKIRLVLPDPASSKKSSPIAITHTEQGVFLIGDDWARPLDIKTIDEATEGDIRMVLQLPSEIPLLLSESLPFPDTYWMSEECLKWTQKWENTLASEWRQSKQRSKDLRRSGAMAKR